MLLINYYAAFTVVRKLQYICKQSLPFNTVLHLNDFKGRQ